MEQEYVIGVANKFAAFLDESEDPYEIIKNVEAEKIRKKALKLQANTENKENKDKSSSAKGKPAVRKPAIKSSDRVPPAEKLDKTDGNTDNVKQRRKQEDSQSQGFTENSRGGYFREGKSDGGAPRGPRTDFVKGERRDGPRPFRGEGDRRGPRSDNEQQPPRQSGEGDVRPARRERIATSFDFEGRQDRRPPSRGRGNRSGFPRATDFRGKRDFDRRSGSDRTGVKAVDKKDGAGAYNWDSNKDVEALATPEINESQQSAEGEENWGDVIQEGQPASPTKEEPVNETEVPPTEDEPEELTLDEYRRRRGQREMPHFDIRKPGEGEDLSQWQGMVEIKKKDADVETDDDLEISEFPQRAGRQRHVVGIDITFSDSFRSGRGRGRAAGPSRGRSRGEGRSFRDDRRDRQSAPKVDDEKAFPSLG